MRESVEEAKLKTKLTLVKFLGKPYVRVLELTIAITSLFLGIFFFLASREKPELTYYVYPVKTAVVRAAQVSHLKILLDDQPFSGDVSAVQVAVWNAGKKPITSNSVLKPCVIRILRPRVSPVIGHSVAISPEGVSEHWGPAEQRVRVLEVKQLRRSRELVHFTIDSSCFAVGEVGVNWDILEQDDGGLFQLIYAGDDKVEIKADAALVGQPEMMARTSKPLPVSRFRLLWKIGRTCYAFALVIWVMWCWYFIWKIPEKRMTLKKAAPLLLVAGLLAACGVGATSLLSALLYSIPPFGWVP